MDEGNQQPQKTSSPETHVLPDQLKAQTPVIIEPKKKSPTTILHLVIDLIIICVAGYFGYMNYMLKNQRIATFPPPDLSTTPTDLPNFKTNNIQNADNETDKKNTIINSTNTEQTFEGGALPKEKYTITIFPGWSVKREELLSNGRSDGEYVYIILDSNQDYYIRIAQGGFSGYKCVYPGEIIEENSNDQMYQNFVEFVDRDGNRYRRALKNEAYPLSDLRNLQYDICEYRDEAKEYSFPTETYENIFYNTPNPAEEKTLKVMDQMLSSMKNITDASY